MVANSRGDADDSALPRPLRPLRAWALASLLLHGALLGPDMARLPEPAPPPVTTPTRLHWRLIAAPAAAPAAPAPAKIAQTAPTPTPTPTAAAQATVATPPAPPGQRSLSLPHSASWRFRLRWRGEDGRAWLHWQQDGERYQLRLQRRTASRELPEWRSEGLVDAGQGLAPRQFSSQGGRGERLVPTPAGSQDRLSWMLQAAALAAAQGLRPGGQLRLSVASWRGEAQSWLLLAERDAEAPGLLRLRRLPPAGAPLEQLLWLDPAAHYRPVRLRQRYDEAERWELIAEPDLEQNVEPDVAR